MKKFQWTYTAIITPFTNEDEVDYKSLEKIVENQISWWITWILFAWTTWESPTFSEKEQIEFMKKTTEMVKWRCQVIQWTGSNCTKEAIFYSKEAEKIWADWILVVSPYYNKPNQKWLFQHFTAIADSANIPIILYNIKWRTWVNIETSTLLKLANHKNIVWVKEASWDISQMMDVIQKVPKDFSILVWDDALTLPFIALWWDWVISVASNYIPKTMSKLTQICLDWDFKTAKKLHYELLELFNDWFIETNPIPAKELMAMLWYCEPNFRLPMCRASISSMKILEKYVEFVRKIEE